MRDFASERESLSRFTAILLDDNPKSIREHVEAAERAHAEVVVVDSLTGLRDHLLKDYWWPILFLDMHMPNINDLGEIGYPGITTSFGANVGLAIARGFLPEIHKHKVPTRILRVRLESVDQRARRLTSSIAEAA